LTFSILRDMQPVDPLEFDSKVALAAANLGFKGSIVLMVERGKFYGETFKDLTLLVESAEQE